MMLADVEFAFIMRIGANLLMMVMHDMHHCVCMESSMLESHFWESLRVLGTEAASTSMSDLSLSRASLIAVLMQTQLFKLNLDSSRFGCSIWLRAPSGRRSPPRPRLARAGELAPVICRRRSGGRIRTAC